MTSNDCKSTHSLAPEQFCEGGYPQIVSLEKVADYLGLSFTELARMVNFDSTSAQLHPSSPDIQKLLRDILRALSLAGETFESSNSAVRWLVDARIPAFRNETALIRICRGRIEGVIQYLHSIGSGYVG